MSQIKFVYFDVGGVVIRDFSGTNKWEEMKQSLGVKSKQDNEFVNRFERNTQIWSVIEEAKSQYKIGLLTNMYPGMLELISNRGLMSDIKWDEIIDSSVEGVAKPDEEIFYLAQKRAAVSAQEILFVENTKGHIDVANKLGWQTFWYDANDPDMLQNLKQALFTDRSTRYFE